MNTRLIKRTLRRLRVHWKRITRGTTRAAGVALCVLGLSAVVVGGSQVMPFLSVQDGYSANEATSDDASLSDDGTSEVSTTATRQLHHTDYNESWKQAGKGWDRLGDIDRRHQVLITPDGLLNGRITTFADWQGGVQPLGNAKLHLMRDGSVAAETTTDADGRFTAEGLREGTYALFAQSSEGMLAYALHLRVAATDAEAANFELQSMAATSWDADAIMGRITNYWQTQPPIERTREPEEETIPVSVKPIPQAGSKATTLTHHQVRLQSDGRLIGRLRRLHPETGRPIIAREIEVAIYRNGTLQGMTWTDEIGYFELPHVAPGIYSLVATGSLSTGDVSQAIVKDDRGLRHGFLAFGIEVLPAEVDGLIQTVAFNAAAELEIDAALVDVTDMEPFLGPSSEMTSAEAGVGTPAGSSGGQAGGSSGSGGGGTGGGGLGSALTAGAVAAGVAALLDDDGVVSPSRP